MNQVLECDDEMGCDEMWMHRVAFRIKVEVPSCPHNFRATEFFRKNMGFLAKVRISAVSQDFTSFFGDMVKDGRFRRSITSYVLSDTMSRKDIESELQPDYEVDLWVLAHLLTQQGRGEREGALLTDGRDNWALCPGIAHNHGAVCLQWHGGGWIITYRHTSDYRYIRNSNLIVGV